MGHWATQNAAGSYSLTAESGENGEGEEVDSGDRPADWIYEYHLMLISKRGPSLQSPVKKKDR